MGMFDSLIVNTFGNVWIFSFCFIILIAVMVFLTKANFSTLAFIVFSFGIFFIGQIVGRAWIGIFAILTFILVWLWWKKLFGRE